MHASDHASSASTWIDVAALEEIDEFSLKSATLGDKPIVLAKVDGKIHAVGGKCPHKGAPLDQGTLCRSSDGAPVIVCPWHKAVFAAVSGDLLEAPALDPLPRHQVRIEGERVLVQAEADARQAPVTSRADETVVVVGAGAAAVAAACHLRELGFDGRITLISPEDELPYDRTALSKMVLGAKPEDMKIPPLRPEEFYDRQRIERRVAAVSAVDVDARTVALEGGETLTCDHLLLASGSRAVRPDFPGADDEQVRLLRTAADAREIVDLAGGDKSAVVVGSGFIGMEAAASLRKRGTGVVVVSRSETPMRGMVGREIGTRLRELHEKNGVAFLSEVAVASVGKAEGGKGGLLVTLDDGTELKADFVLVGVGAEPVTDYLPTTHVGEDGGVEVDAEMRVAPGVYAAGDIASFLHDGRRVRIEHWRTAQSQARVAAQAIMGVSVEAPPVPWFWTQQFDQKLEYLGWPGKADVIAIDGDLASFDFLARLAAGDDIFGVIGSKEARELGRLAVDPPASLVSTV